MSGASGIPQGLGSGRQWTALPEQGEALEWTLNPEGDFLQGPLDLTRLRGRKVFLNLQEDELALLAHEDELRAIFLDGGHILDIGTRQGQIDPRGRLYFLQPIKPIVLRWTHGSPIALPGDPSLHVIGLCHLTITGPARFFARFIRRAPVPGFDHLCERIEDALRKVVIEILGPETLQDDGELQSRLMALGPERLSEDLLDQGLDCTHLALYTAGPPVEDSPGRIDQEFTGQTHQLSHN